MGQEEKRSGQGLRKDFVRDLFGKTGSGKEKVSSIFDPAKKKTAASAGKTEPAPAGAKTPAVKLAPKAAVRPAKLLPAAIDIGTGSVKLCQLAESPGGSIEAACVDMEALPSGVADLTAQQIKSALKNLLARNAVGPECVSMLSSKDVLLYNMALPPMPADEARNAIRFKLSQLKPLNVPVEEIVFRFARWDGGEGGKGHQRVVVACVRKESVEARRELLKDLGLKPVGIGAAPFALVRLSALPGGKRPPQDEVTLWIELDAKESFMAIERAGALCFARSLTLTDGFMTKVIGQRCNVDEEKAEGLKRRYGLSAWTPERKMPMFYEPGAGREKAGDDAEGVYRALVPLMENLVVDIEHSFKHFSYQVAQSQITKFDRVKLCGGGARLINLDRFLSAKLGVPAERVDPFSGIRPSEKMLREREDLVRAPAGFALCTGLAMEFRPGAGSRIDLLPEADTARRKPSLPAVRGMPATAAAAAALCMTGVFFLQAHKVILYENEKTRLAEQVDETKAQIGRLHAAQLSLTQEEAATANDEALLEAKRDMLAESVRRPEQFAAIFEAVAGLMPENVWVTRIAYKKGAFEITGATPDVGLVSSLIDKLKASGEFSDARFGYSRKESDESVYTFEIIAELEAKL